MNKLSFFLQLNKAKQGTDQAGSSSQEVLVSFDFFKILYRSKIV